MCAHFLRGLLVVPFMAGLAGAELLYSIDRTNNRLVLLDTVLQSVTPIGAGLGQNVTQTDLAIANGTLYAVDTNSTVNVFLLEIDTQTGAVVTACQVFFLGQPVLDAEGLAQAGGRLYIAFRIPGGTAGASVSHAVGELGFCSSGAAAINPTTVIDYLPSSPGVDFDGLTEFPCGLTPFPAGDLLAVDHNPLAQTHTYFDLSATIAVTGVFPDVPTTIAVNDLAFCGGQLFGIDDGTKRVTSHNTITGEIVGTAMTYGSQCFPPCSLTGLACLESCVPPPASMVAWWPLDEDTGTTAQDIIGGHHGAQLNGPTPLIGEVVDNALCFNGAGQYVSVPTATPLNLGATLDPDFTIDAWVRADNVTGVHPIVDKMDASPQGFQLFVVNGRLGFLMADPVCAGFVAPTADITAGVWHHVAVTVSRSTTPTGELYVDGGSVHTFTPLSGSLGNGADVWIGQSHANSCGGATTAWDGCIDEVEFFDQALAIDEIGLIRNACRAGKCKPGCCLPDGTCTTTWDQECLAIGGTPVPQCLGDNDLNGIDDACECRLVEDDAGGLGPFCDGLCPVSAVLETCVPRCVNFDPLTQQSTVTGCDCRGPGDCGIVFDPGEPEPGCAGNCPDNTLLCLKTRTVLLDGTIDICCDCRTGTHNRTFSLETLPEPAGTTASEVFAMTVRDFNFEAPKLLLAGRVKVHLAWEPDVWTQQGGGPWALEPLPVADPSVDSAAQDVECESATGQCFAVGSTGDPGSERFTIWSDAGGGWALEPFD